MSDQDRNASSESAPSSKRKINAIYSLRDAAEAKAIAEVEASAHPTPASRDALLAARSDLESRTQDAVEACHECGRPHRADEPHRGDNVLDFRKRGQ